MLVRFFVFRSPPEAALAVMKGPQGAEEINLAKGRPVGIAKVELGINALPEQEARQPHLAAGADDQFRVGHVGSVEVGLDVRRPKRSADFRHRFSLAGLVQQEFPERIHDLLPPAIGHPHVEDTPRVMARGGLRVPDGGPHRLRQGVDFSQRPHPDLVLVNSGVGCQLEEFLLEQLHQAVHFVGVALEIVEGEDPHRHHAHASLLAPVEQLLQLVRATGVALEDGHVKVAAGEPAVAVHDDSDVIGNPP